MEWLVTYGVARASRSGLIGPGCADPVPARHRLTPVIERTAPDGAPTVGVIGGGQLARMLAAPASALGIGLRVLTRAADDPAAQVVADTWLGDWADAATVAEFARGCAVLTVEHEGQTRSDAATCPVHPSPQALRCAQDKLFMRRTLTEYGYPGPRWAQVTDVADVVACARNWGWPVILKAPRGGYDGRGVWRVADRMSAERVLADMSGGLLAETSGGLLAEECVPFERELAAAVARSPSGQAVAYPVVATTQTDGICTEVVAPAPRLSDDRVLAASHLALSIARDLAVTGMLTVELFDTGTDLLINELAMRPHNCGHWSIEGAITSQFENHLRAVLDFPLGDPRLRAPCAVMVNVLGGTATGLTGAYRHVLARDPQVKVHLYGKAVRPGRKLGHVTLLGDRPEPLLVRARHAADYLSGRITE